MRSLNPTDVLFLHLESRRQPMHVGGLLLFRLPDDASPDLVGKMVQDMRQSRVMPVEPFNQILRYGLFWEEDQEFDVDQHFRHVALPRPGRIRELLTYVSHEHSALLDRAKPLWECHVIEGVEGNRFALYFKVHHSMVDGVTAMRLLERAMSYDPADRTTLPLWAVKPSRQRIYHDTRQPSNRIAKLIKPLISVPLTASELYRTFRTRNREPDYVKISQAPFSLLNQGVSASRRYAAQSYELSRLRIIAKKMGMTINDIVLGICSGALRTYLLQQRALPKKPLIAMVPVALQRESHEIQGNNISMILANLATHKADPIRRLEIIHRSVQNAKRRFSRMAPDQILMYSGVVYSVPGLNLLLGVLPKVQAFNIVISNVPGPKQDVYWNGIALDAIYPVSLVLDGQALNITLTSYKDKLEFGIIACRRTLPRIQSLLKMLEEEIHTLEILTADMPALPTTSDEQRDLEMKSVEQALDGADNRIINIRDARSA